MEQRVWPPYPDPSVAPPTEPDDDFDEQLAERDRRYEKGTAAHLAGIAEQPSERERRAHREGR